jgi:putative oxidoreductase
MRRAARIAVWGCQAALALMFLLAGSAKFLRPMWARMFARWGYPDHFYLVIGGLEVILAVALLVPRLAAPAALMLIVIMIGAGVTHALHQELHRLPQILVMSVLLGVIAYARWPNKMWPKRVS